MGTPIEELSESDLHHPPHDPAKNLPDDREPPPAATSAMKDPRRSDDDDDAASARRRPPKMDLLTTTNATTRSTAADERLPPSPSRAREAANRLGDDLAVLQAEREASSVASDRRSELLRRRSREVGDFDLGGVPPSGAGRESSVYRERADTGCGRAFVRIRDSVWLVRYFMYIMPVFLILLVPLLLGMLVFEKATVGDVRLLWFAIWLEIVWLSLWAARILSKCLPWPIGLVSSMFTNNSKKWRDLGKQLEIPATLFFWGLAVEISFLPMMKSHHVDGDQETKPWENTVNKVLVALLVLAVLNFVAKIFIQLIAIRFHLRTYSDRIDVSKFQIASLTKMYQFSRDRIDLPDSEFEEQDIGSGTRTPRKLVREAQKTTVIAFKKIGDVTGKIAGDFAGRDVATSSHPHQVVLSLLSSNEGSQVIARRLYRTFCRDNNDTVHLDDLRPVFDSDDEADAAFAMFDKDMNGDISMEELEAACVEIGRERKSITASLKDLDSVVAKLDQVFFFIVFIIAILVLVTLISSSGAAVLTSAGSTLLALSWLFSATAQEFLQSIIFVFVKHPFDVGDRVSIYGNTGSTLKGDDYFVKKVSLLYTEFKKMEGQVVQAPNNYLNQLFILNQRRSGALAEAIPLTIKFGTTLEQIDSLRLRLLEFVRSEKREYQPNIVTELRDITDVYSLTLNVVFFYKSNWQNEVLRFQRRNKFICALMVSMQELGIEGPRARIPGQSEAVPFYLQRVQPAAAAEQFPEFARADYERGADPGSDAASGIDRVPSLPGRRAAGRRRGESLAQMGRRMDFSLGTKEVAPSDLTGDVFATRAEPRVPVASPTRGEHGVGRSTSVSVLARGEPESDRSRSRFFGALRSRESDLESGTMAGIPVQARIGSRTSRPSIASAVRPVVSHPVLRERSDE